MSEHADFINGLHVVECELERVIGELDEMQDRHGIPARDRVSLDPLQWALNKLADDLHDATVEIRRARLEVVSARRGAEDAREVRDAASQLHLLECRKYNAEFERRLALEKQVTELTAERDSLKQQVAELTEKLGELPDEEDEPFPEPYPWQVGDEIECPGVTRRKVVGTCRPWVSLEGIQEACPQPEWERRGWKLYRKASDVPPEPAPEPYQWQVGDEIEDDGGVRRPVTERNAKGWVFIKGNGALPQFEWERRGWKLHRKASELPDIPPLTEQQVAEFAAATKPFDDSVSAAAADEGRP
jgi:cell division protein FtsB